MLKITLIFFGSGLGGVCRYGVGALIHRLSGSGFPSGTLTVNLVGCLTVGLLAAVFAAQPVRDEIRLLLTVGFLGGFTTFSAFGLDTLNLAQQGLQARAVLYLLASTGGGLLCAWLGFRLGNTVF
jgi:fluoride exporter